MGSFMEHRGLQHHIVERLFFVLQTKSHVHNCQNYYDRHHYYDHDRDRHTETPKRANIIYYNGYNYHYIEIKPHICVYCFILTFSYEYNVMLCKFTGRLFSVHLHKHALCIIENTLTSTLSNTHHSMA